MPVKHSPMNDHERACHIWLHEHRGILKKIASSLKPKMSSQYIGMVLKGQRVSVGGVVERALVKAGAPIKKTSVKES